MAQTAQKLDCQIALYSSQPRYPYARNHIPLKISCRINYYNLNILQTSFINQQAWQKNIFFDRLDYNQFEGKINVTFSQIYTIKVNVKLYCCRLWFWSSSWDLPCHIFYNPCLRYLLGIVDKDVCEPIVSPYGFMP